MSKRIGIIASVCLAFALCFALVGCGGVDKGAYVGTWELESGSDENLSADAIELMKGLGLDVTLTLNEDGTGTMNLFGESMSLTWDATSNTEGTVTFDGNNATLKLADGKLALEDSTGSSMTFAKGDPAAASAASSAAASSEAAASDASAASSEAAASASAESADAASGEAAASGGMEGKTEGGIQEPQDDDGSSETEGEESE